MCLTSVASGLSLNRQRVSERYVLVAREVQLTSMTEKGPLDILSDGEHHSISIYEIRMRLSYVESRYQAKIQ